MAETGLTTVGVLETSSIDPLPENSPMETEDLSKEEEAALFCRNLSEDEETENEIPCAQANQELVKKANEQPIETRLKNSDYPATTVEKHLSEVIFADRKKALDQRNKNARKKILPFATQYHRALPNLKNILMGKWHLIQNQPYLRNIFKEPPLISYRKGKSLKDTLVRAKLVVQARRPF